MFTFMQNFFINFSEITKELMDALDGKWQKVILSKKLIYNKNQGKGIAAP